MNVQVLSCPACGANIDSDNRRIAFCPYCGSNILIDDGIKREETTKNININRKYERIIRDEARIIESNNEYKSNKLAQIPSILLILFIIGFVVFGIVEYNIKNSPSLQYQLYHNIQVQTPAKQYRGKTMK